MESYKNPISLFKQTNFSKTIWWKLKVNISGYQNETENKLVTEIFKNRIFRLIYPNIYQKKLLNFLENKKIFEDLDIKLNHKIITITEKNLEIEIEKGNFIKRLYDRISTDFIKFKSLSDRRDDVLPILDFYLNEKSGGILNFKFSSKALTKLQMYDWPGNISQLINYVEKSLILNQDQNIKELEVDDLALQMGDETASNSSNNSLDLSLKEARSEFEKNYLISQIKRFNGNITKVSEFTGMERTALYRKFKSLDIKVE